MRENSFERLIAIRPPISVTDRSVFALSSFLCFSFVVQCREYQLCVVCNFGFCVLLRFCFLLRFWISPSRKSLLQIFPAWEYIAYRQVFRINQLSIVPSPVLFLQRFFPIQINAVLCVCNDEDPRTQVLSIDITSFFEGQAPVARRVDNTIHWIKLYLVENALRFAITHWPDKYLTVR